MLEKYEFDFYANKAKRLSDAELNFAVVDIRKTLDRFMRDKDEIERNQSYVRRLWLEHDMYIRESIERFEKERAIKWK